MILVDSSVWIDYFNGISTRETNLLDNIVVQEIVAVGDLILVEVLQGFKSDADFQVAKKLLSQFLQVELCGFTTTNQAVQNYRLLRKKGVTVRKTIDVIIATYCILNNISLLHNDRDFEPLTKHCGLMVL